MGAVISPVPPSRNGSDVHNLWGSGSAQPGWAPTCSQLDGCERREKRPEGTCPELPPWPGSSALFSGKLSIRHWRGSLGLTLLWARFLRRQGERGQLVLLLGVALISLRLPSLWGGHLSSHGSSLSPSILMPSWVMCLVSIPSPTGHWTISSLRARILSVLLTAVCSASRIGPIIYVFNYYLLND